MHRGFGRMVGQTGIKVWDACSTVQTQTSYILPVVTFCKCCTFILSWEWDSELNFLELSLFSFISFCVLWSWYLQKQVWVEEAFS